MLAILIGTVILHLFSLILLLISTSVNAWRTTLENTKDLWFDCSSKPPGYQCKRADDTDWLQAVQALMILATIFCILSLFFFVWQLFTLTKGGRFFFTAVFQILSSLFVMSGAIIYTVMSNATDNSSNKVTFEFGYAFVLAWLAFPITLISSLFYIILRKKE